MTVVDIHAHVFPPEVVADRARFVAADAAFAELYASPKARLATAEDLRAGMDAAGVDVSVAVGFAWSDPELCRHHNDYLLEAADRSGGRVLAFPTLPLAAGDAAIAAEARRCAAAGARGFGELRPEPVEGLRPENLGFDLAGEPGRRLGRLARELGLPLLFHASEPVGHAYAGKQGLRLESLYGFIRANPGTQVIAAHWGGGLPFYALMPEVKEALADVYFDTAASSFLYQPAVYRLACEAVGAEHILFGSDFPLLSQARSRQRVEEAVADPVARDLILGGNARRLLGLR